MKCCGPVCSRGSISNSSTGGHQGAEAVETTKGCGRVKRTGKTESVDSPRERAAVIEAGKVPESCQALKAKDHSFSYLDVAVIDTMTKGHLRKS